MVLDLSTGRWLWILQEVRTDSYENPVVVYHSPFCNYASFWMASKLVSKRKCRPLPLILFIMLTTRCQVGIGVNGWQQKV